MQKKLLKIEKAIRAVSTDLKDLFEKPGEEWVIDQLKHQAEKLDKAADDVQKLLVHGAGTGED